MRDNWKSVVGFEHYYEVSSQGEVKSLKRTVPMSHGGSYRVKEKILKQYTSKCGYKFVRLSKGGKYYNKLVHRLVAESFIQNPKGKPQVNHTNKRGDKTINTVGFLEWSTAAENASHAKANGLTCRGPNPRKARIGESHGCAKLHDGLIRWIRRKGAGGKWKKAGEIMKDLEANGINVTQQLVYLIMRRKIWRHIQ